MRTSSHFMLGSFLVLGTLAPSVQAVQIIRSGNSVIINGVSINNDQSSSNSGDMVQGSGRSKQETRTLPTFSRIHIDLPANVEITKGTHPGCTLTADDNILPIIITEVRGGTLTVSSRKGFSNRTQLQIDITAPSLSNLEVDGSGSVALNGLDEGNLDVVTRGSVELRGNGRVEALAIRLEGAGDISLFGLQARSAEVQLSGSGTIQVFARETFSGDIEGSGDILVRGGARIVRSVVNGAGNISPQ
jgi:hypothetical protein